MVEPTCELFNKWKEEIKPVKQLRCDNAGENISLEKQQASAAWKMNIKFECTAKHTQQQNSYAEVATTTILKKAGAMMIGANVPQVKRYALIRESIGTATLLDGLIVIKLDGISKTRLEHWGDILPAWVNGLRTLGEAGVVKVKTKTSPKLNNKGVTCMFVGYSMNRDVGVYRMYA